MFARMTGKVLTAASRSVGLDPSRQFRFMEYRVQVGKAEIETLRVTERYEGQPIREGDFIDVLVNCTGYNSRTEGVVVNADAVRAYEIVQGVTVPERPAGVPSAPAKSA